MLDLPFAARRLFDAEGKEHFTLQSLTRDQLVYVSCGEPWSDPNLSKAEQQRRYLLANLASDVGQMRQFMALRNPQSKPVLCGVLVLLSLRHLCSVFLKLLKCLASASLATFIYL